MSFFLGLFEMILYVCRRKINVCIKFSCYSIKELGFEVEDFIPIVVQFGNLSVKKSDDKKLILESETFRIVIQTRWDNQEKIFLLTAFDLRKKPE